jgi:hypothetical protein
MTDHGHGQQPRLRTKDESYILMVARDPPPLGCLWEFNTTIRTSLTP